MPNPAPAPEDQALQRVLSVSRLNGDSVTIFAGVCVVAALLLGDWVGALVCLLVGAAGWMEVHGNRRLRRDDPAGLAWMVRSQLALLAVILAYCAWSLGRFDAGYIQAQVLPRVREWAPRVLGFGFDELLEGYGLTMADFMRLLHQLYLLFYGVVVLTALLYQGGLAVFYRRKTALVTAALSRPPLVPPPVPVLPPPI